MLPPPETPPVRAVSLVPSITETLLAWGVVPVACTRFCEQPALPHVGGTKDPDVDAVVALRPDVVLVNDEENRVEDVERLEAAGLEVHVVRVESVEDVAPAMAALAARFGVAPPVVDLPTARPVRTRAFVPIWRRPWMTLNGRTYGSSLLARVGVANVFAEENVRYPETSLEEASGRRPDVVVAPSEPYPFGERHRPELETVAPVVLVDGQDLFWWGTRTPAAIERLAARLASMSA